MVVRTTPRFPVATMTGHWCGSDARSDRRQGNVVEELMDHVFLLEAR